MINTKYSNECLMSKLSEWLEYMILQMVVEQKIIFLVSILDAIFLPLKEKCKIKSLPLY